MVKKEYCAICGCELHRGGEYGTPRIKGRSHATAHHYIAKRFLFSSKKGTRPIFKKCPWDLDKKTGTFCYDCHEELLHNPIFLPEDIKEFAELVAHKNLNELKKRNNQEKLAGRIMLLHEVLERGIQIVKNETNRWSG